MKKLILLFTIAFAIFMASCNSCNSNKNQETLSIIKNEKKIKVGYIDYFDITTKDLKSGEVKGFLVDVLVEVLKEVNISKNDIEFVETDWQNFSLGLESKKYQLSIAGTFKTPVRAKAVNFSRPIFYLGNGAVVKKDDNRFKSISDVNQNGIKIAVVQGEQGYEYAKKNLPKASITALSGSDLSLAPLQVKLGKADVALSDQYILRRYTDKNLEVKDALADNPYDVLPICWAVSKDNKDTSILKYINQQLQKMESNGTMQTLLNKYSMIPFANINTKDGK